MKYLSFDQLNGKTLQKNDSLVINNIYYFVDTNPNLYLRAPTRSNDIIFTNYYLNKTLFCDDICGYSTMWGDFPELRKNDYEGLTKIALALFALSEKSKGVTFLDNNKEIIFNNYIDLIGRINNYLVKFLQDGVKVGCTVVPYEQVKAIYKKAVEQKFITP